MDACEYSASILARHPIGMVCINGRFDEVTDAILGSRKSLGHELLGRGEGSDALHLGALEHQARCVPDLTDGFHRTRSIIPVGFFGDVDDPTRVSQKVRHVENTGRRERVRNLRTSELIVRRADNDRAVKIRHCIFSEQPP